MYVIVGALDGTEDVVWDRGGSDGRRLPGFSVQARGETVHVQPHEPLDVRCTIRPLGLFAHDRGYWDAAAVMGRLSLPRGSCAGVSYRPFTRDPARRLRAVFLPIETMPEDDWAASAQRWAGAEFVARHALRACGVAWHGLERRTVRIVLEDLACAAPIEWCALHALTQWTHARGDCVIEVGAGRGGAAPLLALALEGGGSPIPVVSIGGGAAAALDGAHMRLVLRQIDQGHRLVQIPSGSDDAARVLRTACASLVVIDGDHAYEAVIADFARYDRLLVPGGCMVFRGYGIGPHTGRPDAHPGVRRAVDEHVFGHAGYRPVLSADTMIAFVKRGSAG
ncbi:MAG: class I SAM-dependent methyltransferase [Phycisphaerae bacterium]